MRLFLFLMLLVCGACATTPPPAMPARTDVARDATSKTVALVMPAEGLPPRTYCAGVWVAKDQILTAGHCTELGEVVSFKTSEDSEIGLGLVAKHAKVSDLALIQVADPPDHPSAGIYSEMILPGDPAYTVGHPLGLGWTFTFGHVSKPLRLEEAFGAESSWIQATTPIGPGNSGGGLWSETGGLMGVCSWGFTRGQNLNFFVHRDVIRDFLEGS